MHLFYARFDNTKTNSKLQYFLNVYPNSALTHYRNCDLLLVFPTIQRFLIPNKIGNKLFTFNPTLRFIMPNFVILQVNVKVYVKMTK